MPPRSAMSPRERQIRSSLTQLLHTQPILCGSLVRMARSCGKPRCKCTRGQEHLCLCVSVRVANHQKLLYIPRRLEDFVSTAVGNYRTCRRLMQSLSDLCLQEFLRCKQGGER